MSDVYSHVDLFSGIGGFALAAQWAGYETVLFCENERHCREVLRADWPEVPIIDDVRDVHEIKCDIITGGFPCQDLSVAGNRAGLAGERSGLWREFARIIADVRPAWVVIENVPGLLSSNKGRDMGAILGALGDLGYWWAYRVLDAQYYGVAQRRRRVFIVGHTRARRAAEVLLEPEGLCWNPPPSRETGQTVTALTANGVGTCGADDNQAQGGHLIAKALLSHGQHIDYDTETFVYDGGQGIKARSIGYAVEQSPTLRVAESGSNRAPCVVRMREACAGGGKGPLVSEDSSLTLSARNDQTLVDGASVRRLTPLECERLQGFPDGWTEGHADSHRYRMLGNAVAVPVVEWIMRRIIEAQ